MGNSALDLTGWTIADDDGNDFSLNGSITANATRTITRDRSAMLSNNSDAVILLSPAGEAHRVIYAASQVSSGQMITFGP